MVTSKRYHILGGVDRKNVPKQYLVKYGADYNYNPENLREACELMGMNCSKFVFYHSDLGPGNIIEDVPVTGFVGIIDWEALEYIFA